MTTPFVITIGRQLGSGGRQIGRLIADRLQIEYFDKEILDLAARESGFRPELFEESDEKNSFLRSIFGNIIPFFGSPSEKIYPDALSRENLFRLQADAIRKAAAERSAVFIGRCADYVLRDHPRCLNVFLTANMEDRIAQVMLREGIDRAEAERRIESGDRQRASFYNFYSSGTWGAAATYDLCINSSLLGMEETAELIIGFARKRFENL